MARVYAAFGAALAFLSGCGAANSSPSASVTSAGVTDRDVIVLAEGWQPTELSKILETFERKYGMERGELQATTEGGVSRIRLTRAMPADQVLYLVNYIHYPDGFDVNGRSPVAVAIARLNAAFGANEPPLAGRTATFYVPTHDTSYDEVYATVDNGTTFRVSFTDLSCEPAVDARRSHAVEALMASAPSL